MGQPSGLTLASMRLLSRSEVATVHAHDVVNSCDAVARVSSAAGQINLILLASNFFRLETLVCIYKNVFQGYVAPLTHDDDDFCFFLVLSITIDPHCSRVGIYFGVSEH